MWGWAIFREEVLADGRIARTGPEIVPSAESAAGSFRYQFVDASARRPGTYYRYTVWAVTGDGLLARAFSATRQDRRLAPRRRRRRRRPPACAAACGRARAARARSRGGRTRSASPPELPRREPAGLRRVVAALGRPRHGPRGVEHRDVVAARDRGPGLEYTPRSSPTRTVRPVSSSVSRAQQSSVVSFHSQKPPGRPQRPGNGGRPRWTSRTRPLPVADPGVDGQPGHARIRVGILHS